MKTILTEILHYENHIQECADLFTHVYSEERMFERVTKLLLNIVLVNKKRLSFDLS